jgi:hypothetical protein
MQGVKMFPLDLSPVCIFIILHYNFTNTQVLRRKLYRKEKLGIHKKLLYTL